MKSQNIIKSLTEKIIELVAEEVGKKETQVIIRKKLVVPLINLIYSELYPYILTLVCIIFIMLLLSVLTFIGFIFYRIKF
jgi:hypothetical protein